MIAPSSVAAADAPAQARPRRGPRGLRAHGLVLLAPLLAGLAAWALSAAGLPLAIEAAFGTLLAGSIAFILLRPDCLMWSTYIAGLIAHSVLWDRAASLGAAVRFDYVAEIDRVLGLGALPTVRLQEALFRQGLFSVIDWSLLVVYFSFYALPLFLLTPLRKRNYEHGRRYIAAVLLASLLAWPVFALLPTAPPWLAASEGIEAASLVLPLKSMLQGLTASSYLMAGTNLVAAMPSLHQAVAVICALAATRAWPRLRWGALVYALAMGMSLVYLGEHYLIDVLAGAVLGLGAWTAVQQLDARAGRTRWRLASAAVASSPSRESDVR